MRMKWLLCAALLLNAPAATAGEITVMLQPSMQMVGTHLISVPRLSDFSKERSACRTSALPRHCTVLVDVEVVAWGEVLTANEIYQRLFYERGYDRANRIAFDSSRLDRALGRVDGLLGAISTLQEEQKSLER